MMRSSLSGVHVEVLHSLIDTDTSIVIPGGIAGRASVGFTS